MPDFSGRGVEGEGVVEWWWGGGGGGGRVESEDGL